MDAASGNARRGSKKWIACYMPALKEAREDLTDEEVAAINQVKEEWQKLGVPEELQAKLVPSVLKSVLGLLTWIAVRLAEGKGRKHVKDMHRILFKTMGMRCVTFSNHYDKNGEMKFAM